MSARFFLFIFLFALAIAISFWIGQYFFGSYLRWRGRRIDRFKRKVDKKYDRKK